MAETKESIVFFVGGDKVTVDGSPDQVVTKIMGTTFGELRRGEETVYVNPRNVNYVRAVRTGGAARD